MSVPLSVLVVEDSEDDASLLVRQLESCAYSVSFRRVDNATDMIEALGAVAWDIVISDYAMPGFGGLAALDLFAKHRKTDVPFILVSGTIGEETAVAAMKAGAHDYIMKGKLARLGPAVERELRQAELRRKEAAEERALGESERRMRDIIEFFPDATFILDNERRVTFWNRAVEDLTGVAKDAMIGKGDYAYAVPFYGAPRPILVDLTFGAGAPGGQAGVEANYDYVVRKGNGYCAEAYTPGAYGGKGAYLWAMASPLFDRDGNRVGAIESIHDITALKMNEKALRKSLDEKEILLREIHHRVKNNLQIIVSLIGLAEDEAGISPGLALRQTKKRIAAMSIIHNHVLLDGNAERIDFADCLGEVLGEIVDGEPPEGGGATFDASAADFALPLEKAIPCALLVGEMLFLALDIASKAAGGATVSLSLTSDGDKRHRVAMTETASLSPIEPDSFGMRLIQALAAQLKGSVETSQDGDSCRITVHFPG